MNEVLAFLALPRDSDGDLNDWSVLLQSEMEKRVFGIRYDLVPKRSPLGKNNLSFYAGAADNSSSKTINGMPPGKVFTLGGFLKF